MGSSAQCHLITSRSQEAKEKGSQSQLHEDNAVPTGSSPTAHYVHSLHFCRDVHLESQTSSEVDILVLQSQVFPLEWLSKENRCSGQWIMRQSENRTKFIRNLKITVERTSCTLCCLPININGETSLFILFVEMMDVPALEQMLSSGQHCKEAILRHNENCYNLYQMCPMTSVGEGPGFHVRSGWALECFLPSHSYH